MLGQGFQNIARVVVMHGDIGEIILVNFDQ